MTQVISSRNYGNPETTLEGFPKCRSHGDMERLPTKVLKSLQGRDESQARAARAIGVDASQFSKWLKGKGVPTAAQLLALARHLGLPMEYLADDALDAPPATSASAELTADQRTILQVVDDLGLSRKEAVRRLAGQPKVDEDWGREGQARLLNGNGGPATPATGGNGGAG
jgi:transcriptional regulator with XRE-family HTH domain